jgi:streptomycin 6-kinase
MHEIFTMARAISADVFLRDGRGGHVPPMLQMTEHDATDSELAAAMERWQLMADGEPRHTPSGCVLFVRRNAQRLVVKIVGTAGDELLASPAYDYFSGRGAVTLVARAGRALLLERIAPGHALTQKVLAGDDDGATAVLCDVMRALHRDAPPPPELATVEDWGADLSQDHAADGPLPLALVSRAAAVFDELCRSQGPRICLHGDLHHDNVLFDAERGWLAIDPKGVIGERAYECGALLRNPTEDAARFADPNIIDRRVRIICECLGLDRPRVIGWCFAQAVLAAVWAGQDGRADRRGLATAEAVLPLLRKAS